MTRLPDGMPRPVIAVAAMVVLAGLDFAGAVLARRWAQGGSLVYFGAGCACFLALFWIYASSLRYADLVAVTFGWIAALQIGLLLVGRAGSAAPVPMTTWLAAGAIVALEGYLLVTSSTTP